MLFNSLTFAIFFPIVFLLYWFTWKDVRLWLTGKRLAVANAGQELSGGISTPFVGSRSIQSQNILLLIASYTFYGWWDWRFCGLMLFSTLLDFILGQAIFNSKSGRQKKFFLMPKNAWKKRSLILKTAWAAFARAAPIRVWWIRCASKFMDR